MGEASAIEWTDHTFNPWWGCVKISPACKNCYAEKHDARFAGNDPHWGVGSSRRFFGDKHWNEPRRWNDAAAKARKQARVFCASMADVFEDREDLVEHRDRLWHLIDETPWLNWLLLTKRPENIAHMLPGKQPPRDPAYQFAAYPRAPSNVWLGTTIEHQDYIERAAHILRINASVHFLSCEPLLGPLDITGVLTRKLETPDGLVLEGEAAVGHGGIWRHAIDWVIVGSESGNARRDTHPAWIRSLRDQVANAGKHFFLKQAQPWNHGAEMVVALGIGKGDGTHEKAGGLLGAPYLDGRQHLDVPAGYFQLSPTVEW